MICRYEYKNGILFQTVPDVMTVNNLHSLSKEMNIIDNEYSIMPNRLVNLQAMKSFQGDFNTLLDFVNQRKMILQNQVKMAILVANDFQFGFAQMIQTLQDNPKITIEIFLKEQKAIEWLKTEGTD